MASRKSFLKYLYWVIGKGGKKRIGYIEYWYSLWKYTEILFIFWLQHKFYTNTYPHFSAILFFQTLILVFLLVWWISNLPVASYELQVASWTLKAPVANQFHQLRVARCNKYTSCKLEKGKRFHKFTSWWTIFTSWNSWTTRRFNWPTRRIIVPTGTFICNSQLATRNLQLATRNLQLV